MAKELSEQRTSLEREVGRLEDLLEADANWRALRALLSTGADGAATPSTALQRADHQQERLRLERALKSNRVYCARERLLEVIELMDPAAEGGAEAAAGDPDLFDERPPALNEPAALSMPHQARQDIALPAQDTFSGKDSGAQGDAFRTRVKVKIRNTPPDTDPADLRTKPHSPPDDLTAIRGLDRSVAARLNALGVTRWEQIAAWRTSDVRSVSAALGLNREISRGNWIEQAALLSARAGRTVAASGVAVVPTPVAADNHDYPATRIDSITEPANDEPQTHAELTGNASPADAEDANPTIAADSVLPTVAVGGMIATAVASIAGRLGDTRAAALEETSVAAAADAVEKIDNAEPAEEASPVPPPALTAGHDKAPNAPDALTRIRTLTPEQEAELTELEITSFAQIANWDVDDVANISVVMGLGSRISRDNWIEQAAVLARGGLTAYARTRAEVGAVSLAAAPAEPLRADPHMQARLADISKRLATPVAEAAEPTTVAEVSTQTPVPEPQTQSAFDVASQTAAECEETNQGGEPSFASSAEGTTPKELSASPATVVVLSASAAHALTAFASSQKLGSQLRQDVVIEPQSQRETSTPSSSTEVASEPSSEQSSEPASEPRSEPRSEPTSEADAADRSIDEDDIATEVVLPVTRDSEASTTYGETAAAHTADALSDDASDTGDDNAEAAQIAIIDIPAEDSTAAIDALEADVKLVPRGSPVPFNDISDETEDVPIDAPAARSFAPRSTGPSAEEFDDDDLPAWNGQIEEASVEIVPIAVRGESRPREYDEPAPSQHAATAQPNVESPENNAEARRSSGPDDADEKPVNRFLKALDGGR